MNSNTRVVLTIVFIVQLLILIAGIFFIGMILTSRLTSASIRLIPYVVDDMKYAYLVVAMFVVGFFFMAQTDKRTMQGARWLGQVLGLKRFIETTEISRLEMLVEETPYLFYDVLPYAYVLGLSDTWSKKFETLNIASPDWYSTYDNRVFSTYYMYSALSRSMTSVETNFQSYVSSSSSTSSGGGYSGGGFGGGGGGFSGGGFGGGGGGGW